MKKRKIFLFMFTMLFALLITGCFQDPVQEDLENYVNNEILPIIEEEKEILHLYDSVTGVNFVDDYVLYETIQSEIIPKYQVFIDKLENIKPSTSEVREIHEIYIEASNTQYSAMIMMLDAIDNQDHGIINEANHKLDDARKLFRSFQYEFEDLMEEHNLEFEEFE